MEIDFLGLKSKHYLSTDYETEQKNGMDRFTGDSGIIHAGDGISLSLSTSSALDYHMRTLGFHEENILKLHSDATTPGCGSSYTNGSWGNHNWANGPINPVQAPSTFSYPSPTTCFKYDLNEKPVDPRDISELSTQLSSPSNVYSSFPEKAQNQIYTEGRSSSTPTSATRNCSGAGYTPTVAMARRATLARFLEKRLHRMTQTRTSGVTGKSSTSPNFEPCNTNSTGCNKIRKKKFLISS